MVCKDPQELTSEERDSQHGRQSEQWMQRTKHKNDTDIKTARRSGMGSARQQITREEGTSWVIEGLAGHMKDFDIYPLGSPQPERIFFLSDLGSGGECKEEGED